MTPISNKFQMRIDQIWDTVCYTAGTTVHSAVFTCRDLLRYSVFNVGFSLEGSNKSKVSVTSNRSRGDVRSSCKQLDYLNLTISFNQLVVGNS